MLWCLVIALLYLFFSWLKGVSQGLLKLGSAVHPPSQHDDGDPKAILEKWLRVLSVPLSPEYLVCPMSDPAVRQDEKGWATTWEQAKPLRDRLGNEIVVGVKKIHDGRMDGLKGAVEKVQKTLDEAMGASTGRGTGLPQTDRCSGRRNPLDSTSGLLGPNDSH